jgi:non-specific serine/threonine protein kinase
MLAERLRPVYASGECEIDLARRELRVVGSPVPVGGRAFEIVEILAESAGKLVTKEELMNRVWPGAIVNDNTLQMHISAVRKALGPHRAVLKTESGRGYRLLGTWTARDRGPTTVVVAQPPSAIEKTPVANIPAVATALIGRSTAVQRLTDLVSAYRVVTLTGPGGIGKTALALEVAGGLLGEFEGAAWLVELASLSDPNLVPTAVASVLGLTLGGEQISAEAVARAVGGTNLLLILDNCEHVIDAAANFAEALVRMCPRTTILATSRETLRINGEYVYRVPRLEVPAVVEDEPDQILGYSAVELFIARTKALDSDFSPRAETLPAIGAICRRLDGIPLAIEFAAARAAMLGVQPVAAGLHDRFTLLTRGRRTALPRHQTLRATLDWSHELLPEAERLLFRRLAIFPAGFTLDAAAAVMTDTGLDAAAVTDGVANLVAKSLIMQDKSETGNRWYLLETIRAYALEKLEKSAELRQTARRHAEFYLALFAPFAAERELQTAIDNLGNYRREVDNLRAALNWVFSLEGDTALGVALAAAATDFWVAVSQIAEASEWAGRALALIGDEAGSRLEMVLQCNLGMALIYTKGMIAPAREVLRRALALAQLFADFNYQQRALHGLWLFSARSMAINDALAYARQYEELSRDRDPHSQATADWLVGHTQLYLAENREASMRLQRAIDQYPIKSRDRDMIRFVNDLRASAFGHLSASLLSLGLLDAASQVATNAIDEARATKQPIVLCIALTWEAGLIFLSLGDLDRAERCGEELIDHAHKHALRPFHAAGLCVRGSLAAKRGDPESGLAPLRRGLAGMQEASYLLFYPFFRAELAAALGAMGRVDEGLAEIDAALNFATETGHRWFIPEMLRVKGQLLALRDANDPAIEDCFNRGAKVAREQDALFWELRLALSLANLRMTQHRRDEARQILAPVYEKFTEGFETTDLRTARAMLDTLS